MAWHGIEGHDRIVEQFRRATARGRLASSFLFVGPEGVGKRSFAIRLAQAMLCDTRPEAELDPCETCPACRQVATGSHPDLHVVSKPAEKSSLPVELLIGRREYRGREGLCYEISLRPYSGKRRIAVIDDADHLFAEGANALLKTLEEPPPKSVLILLGTSPAKQLPTIRSRCQLVRFGRLTAQTVAELLLREGVLEDPARARELAEHSEGSLTRAMELTDPDLWSFRGVLLEQLTAPVLDSVHFAKTVSSFVDAAGKAAPPRRARLRQIVRFATQFYRQLLLAQSGSSLGGEDELRRLADHALASGGASGQQTVFRLERCLAVAEQIDRNANQTTLIECWLDDLAGAVG
ncbi:MAG: AAA family ATPase [Thermoguttaceae bacterium]|jgi:DNA polymerase-3 subunit delta'|nr:AAA family ATPase [Thermoguttaceae bacterium]